MDEMLKIIASAEWRETGYPVTMMDRDEQVIAQQLVHTGKAQWDETGCLGLCLKKVN